MASDKTPPSVVSGVSISWEQGECTDALRITKDFDSLVAKQDAAGYSLLAFTHSYCHYISKNPYKTNLVETIIAVFTKK